jgi:hypothetical protein
MDKHSTVVQILGHFFILDVNMVCAMHCISEYVIFLVLGSGKQTQVVLAYFHLVPFT